jgi:hypothetical protein
MIRMYDTTGRQSSGLGTCKIWHLGLLGDSALTPITGRTGQLRCEFPTARGEALTLS